MGHEVTRSPLGAQQGGALLLFIVGIFFVAATISALKMLLPAQRGARQIEVTTENLAAIQNALVAYVAINGYLPCPANPLAAADGAADPAPPSAICGTDGGVVPWATLGIQPEVALDGWQRRISYRVFSGGTGLTQLGGADMTNCDSNVTVVPPALNAGNLCNASQTNSAAQFLAGKGLSINDSGNLIPGLAFVLISHGESGYGAYLPGGARVQMPAAGSAELANTGTISPFIRNEHSAGSLDPGVAAHYDDILAWSSISDLTTKSARSARDW